MVTKSLTSFWPWRHLWTTPKSLFYHIKCKKRKSKKKPIFIVNPRNPFLLQTSSEEEKNGEPFCAPQQQQQQQHQQQWIVSIEWPKSSKIRVVRSVGFQTSFQSVRITTTSTTWFGNLRSEVRSRFRFPTSFRLEKR